MLAGCPTASVPPWPSRPAIRAGFCDITRATSVQVIAPEVDHHLADHRERGLQAEHPEGGVDERVLLVVARVRRVVGGDRVDGAVGQRVAQRGDVLVGAQRRVHLVDRVVAGEQVGGQQQVVRRHLGGDVDALRLGPADHLDRTGGGHVGDVHPAVGVPGEHHVARDDGLLGDAGPAGQPEAAGELALVAAGRRPGEVGVLRVLGDDAAEGADVLQRPPHHPRVVHALAVVGEDPHLGARARHQAELGELLARRGRGSPHRPAVRRPGRPPGRGRGPARPPRRCR